MKLRVGAHTSIAGGVYRALERGAEVGCDVIQLFTRSNQQWASKPLTEEDVARWSTARAATGVEPAMAHGSYLVNLAAADRALRSKSYRALREEYDRCEQLDVPCLVIHPGSHMGQGEARGIGQIVAALDRLADERSDATTRVLLENTAGQGTSIGHRFEHLRDILAQVAAPDRLGVCIDTCHTFAAGYDISTRAGWHAIFADFDRLIGCDKICAFHVNDSKKALGSRVDRHDDIGRGHLGLTAFHALVNDERFVGLPMAIETAKPADSADAVNIAVLRALHGISRVGPRARRLVAQPLDQWP